MSEASRYIRDTLEDLLSDELGTYTLPTGQSVPAIWHKLKPPPDDRIVSGLEVIVTQTPIDPSVTPMYFRQAAIDRSYQVRLVNHGGTQISEETISKVVFTFKDCSFLPLPASSIAPEQYVFTLKAQPILVR